MRMVMNNELGIMASYTLEASMSGYGGYHFSCNDLLRMGEQYCLSLLEYHKKLHDDLEEPNEDLLPLRLQRAITDPQIPIEVLCDSDGSDSNPSESNLSENEVLMLLTKGYLEPSIKGKTKKNRRKAKKALPHKAAADHTGYSIIGIGNRNIGDVKGKVTTDTCSRPVATRKTKIKDVTRRIAPSLVGSMQQSKGQPSVRMITFPIESMQG